jgi:hypothetical protein
MGNERVLDRFIPKRHVAAKAFKDRIVRSRINKYVNPIMDTDICSIALSDIAENYFRVRIKK